MPDRSPQLNRELARLERDKQRESERADKLQSTLDVLTHQLAGLNDEVRKIRKMLQRREAQLKATQRENRKLRRQLGLDEPDPEPQAAEVPDASEPGEPVGDGTSGGTGGDRDAQAEGKGGEGAGPAKPEASVKRKRKGGRRAPPKHLPETEEVHEVEACACCGGRVYKRDRLTSRVYSVVQTHVRCRTIVRERVLCAEPSCGMASTAPMPPMPCKRPLYDASFIAWLVTMKFGYMMPLDRVQALLKSQGVEIATGTLVHLMERAARLADAVDGEHLKQLKAGDHLCFDGTGLKVLIPGQRKAWDGYLEVYTRDALTVFQFDMTKSAEALRDRLSKLDAILVTDAESRNKAGAPGATFVHCNAHVVRSLKDAAKVNPTLAAEGLALMTRLYAVEDEAKRLGLTGEDLRVHRQQAIPLRDELRDWLEGVIERALPPSDPVGKVARYYLKHWEGLTRYLDSGTLPIDNNSAEREFQRHAKLRLASLFAGSVEGAHRWATLLGVVRTAQKHDLDLQAYLTWMFDRRGTYRAQFGLSARELTPAAYRAAGCPGSLTSVTPEEALAA